MENNGHEKQIKFFTTKKAICEHYCISDTVFKLLLDLGFPAVKINNQYYAHVENTDEFLKAFTVRQESIELDQSEGE